MDSAKLPSSDNIKFNVSAGFFSCRPARPQRMRRWKLNGGEIREMLETCRKAGIKLAVGHQRHLDPVFQLAKTLLHASIPSSALVGNSEWPETSTRAHLA
jgi:hypothetical protein